MKPHRIKCILIAYGLVLNDYTLGEKQISEIRKAAPDATVVVIKDEGEWNRRSREIGPEVDVFFGLRPGNWFDRMPNLQWAQQTGAGANWLLESPEFANSDVILTNASGIHAIPISEHILALMFCLSRGIHQCIRNQVNHKWERKGPVSELEGSTLGVIGERELKAMKNTARIINIARGPVIQEQHLIKALEEKWIAGAGLDVFEEEPLPPDSPLWETRVPGRP